MKIDIFIISQNTTKHKLCKVEIKGRQGKKKTIRSFYEKIQ